MVRRDSIELHLLLMLISMHVIVCRLRALWTDNLPTTTMDCSVASSEMSDEGSTMGETESFYTDNEVGLLVCWRVVIEISCFGVVVAGYIH